VLTVGELVAELELELVCGGGDAAVRWVHVSELADPTPWLSGGELLLTTGMVLSDEAEQRAYVRRLVSHGIAGLGFGTGFGWEELPAALLDEARARDFALFAVPYEMPFIAITERAGDRLVNEQYELLQRAVAIQRRVERLVLAEQGLDDVVRALANAIGATLVVLDAGGEVLASHAARRTLSPRALDSVRRELGSQEAPAAFAPAHEEIAGRSVVLPLPGATQWLLAVGEAGAFADFVRFVAQHAVMVVALALMRQHVVAATERRLAGDVLGGALSGSLTASELHARLAPFGITGDCIVAVFSSVSESGAGGGGGARLERAMQAMGVDGLVATVPTARRRLLCAVMSAPPTPAADPLALAQSLRGALEDDSARAAVSRVAPVEALRRSFHEARCALEVGSLANGHGPLVASADDLGAYRLLLSLQDDEGLRIYCDDLLRPIEESRTGNGEELMRSLEAYLEHNGSWEAAARALFCHRHTLRYRIARIEELTGRRLDVAQHRIEFWLALRGRELLA
jgi:purine catabolism regulator